MNKSRQSAEYHQKTSQTDEEKKRILVVEDDRTHRALMNKILEQCEFQTETAENGIIALSKIDKGDDFDLILMDWDMPELDGLETTKQIRAREIKNTAPRTPIIAFTSNRQPEDREQCLAAGMDAYLPKDVWMPNWNATLINNLQGLIAGNFELSDFEDATPAKKQSEDFETDLFDIQTLEQTAALLKNDLAIAVEEYLEDAAAYIRDIQEGLEEQDADKAARGSHPLKSNSKGFGLISMSHIAEAINTHARAGNISAINTLLPQLQKAFDRAEKKLRETMKIAEF